MLPSRWCVRVTIPFFAGKFYELPGLDKVRKRAKAEFMKHKDETDPEKIKRKGRCA